MKKLINDPRRVVREMLEGVVDLNPAIALLDSEDVVIRADLPEPAHRTVAVLSGGGAGHEPAHAGYVGAGMLHAAVSGDVFTSPSVDAVFAAIRAVGGPRGVVLIVKNYTGDRLNFGLAAEMARAAGIPVEIVIVADDVALRETVPADRRRGIAGTVLVHKVAGALAESGASVHDVAMGARAAAAALGTMGVALGACTVPAAGTPGFTLGDDEIELGLGIHGEQGVQRSAMRPADALVDTILEAIAADRGLKPGARVALMVNGLGGTPPMELSIVARHALAWLRAHGMQVERAWCGTFLSALEMPGCSLSVLPVDDARLALLDAPTTVQAWGGRGTVPQARVVRPAPGAAEQAPHARSTDRSGPAVLAGAVACADALAAAERRLTELDSAAGDGDLGISMVRGGTAIRGLTAAEDAASTLAEVAGALRRAIAGSSGPFYAVGILRAAAVLAAAGTVDASAWAEAFEQAAEAVSDMGGAKVGDCTMLDALVPAAQAFRGAVGRGASLKEALAACATAAETGAAATAQMRPRLGRGSYLGDRALGVEDPGAVAVAIWVRALAG
ncbi:MAG TPA: dihydroxyacetone kinase family protein [Rhodopila sp.]|uniref:dihydroxyacetone kinase family protein n=1 Tax=Rhodopila sp. TaxID=2480087 RepID=UPI002BBB854B|nr:dihydroxyacetone kinase family protein [Rhodopila sp.]HVY17805.1 dihydroxyacetone kinase family protein [Rhodopila sp.]